MSLLVILLALVAGPQLCIGDEKRDAFLDLSTSSPPTQNEIVDTHNDLRKSVVPKASNMLKMEWDEQVRENSEKVANSCIYDHSKPDQRTIENGTKCGENLFFSSVPRSWAYAIQAWYDEHVNFTYGQGAKYLGAVVGHYTQVVWYKSSLIGCAVAKCPQKLPYFYVCHYCPAGNIQGPDLNKPYKIGEPCGDCPDNCDAGLCTNRCKVQDKYANCPQLKKDFTCKHEFVKTHCSESCECTTEII